MGRFLWGGRMLAEKQNRYCCIMGIEQDRQNLPLHLPDPSHGGNFEAIPKTVHS